jgi:hypothetical protein
LQVSDVISVEEAEDVIFFQQEVVYAIELDLCPSIPGIDHILPFLKANVDAHENKKNTGISLLPWKTAMNLVENGKHN